MSESKHRGKRVRISTAVSNNTLNFLGYLSDLYMLTVDRCFFLNVYGCYSRTSAQIVTTTYTICRYLRHVATPSKIKSLPAQRLFVGDNYKTLRIHASARKTKSKENRERERGREKDGKGFKKLVT